MNSGIKTITRRLFNYNNVQVYVKYDQSVCKIVAHTKSVFVYFGLS